MLKLMRINKNQNMKQDRIRIRNHSKNRAKILIISHK